MHNPFVPLYHRQTYEQDIKSWEPHQDDLRRITACRIFSTCWPYFVLPDQLVLLIWRGPQTASFEQASALSNLHTANEHPEKTIKSPWILKSGYEGHRRFWTQIILRSWKKRNSFSAHKVRGMCLHLVITWLQHAMHCVNHSIAKLIFQDKTSREKFEADYGNISPPSCLISNDLHED